MKKIILFLIAFMFIFSACTTSKSLAKKAKSLEDASQYEQASEFYYQSLKKSSANVDALIGMKRTGTLVLNDYLTKFSKAKLNENYKEATYTYIDAVAYQKRIKEVGVDLKIPEFTTEDFKIIKKAYLNNEYEEGLKFIEEERFTDAELKFNEVYRFDQNFKEVKELRNIAFLEPYYRKANTYKDNKEYRKAYEAYQRILKRVPNYKDTEESCKYILKKGRINVMMITKKSISKYTSYTKSVKSYTVNALIKKNDPFIKLVDRENMDKILEEQELSVSGLVNENEALEVGELTGAQYAISIEVTSFSVVEKPIKKGSYKGFEKYREKFNLENSDIVQYRTKYRPVSYYISKGSRTVNLTTHFKLVSLKTGEIINSEIIEEREVSKVEFLTYNGDVKALYPNNDGKVNTSRSAHDRLVKLNKANRTLSPKEQLTNKMYNNVSQRIADITVNKLSK